MENSFAKTYFELEKSGWWCVARRNMILKLVAKYAKNHQCKVLDIGSSSGELLCDLKNVGYKHVYGIDINADAIKLSQQKGLSNTIVMDAAEIERLPEEFDLIIASDVLEHVEYDINALTLWKKKLTPSGKMILFVPAFMSLWSHHDVVNHHHRRYTKYQLIHCLEQAGLEPIRSSYWNILLCLPVWIVRKCLNKINKNKNKHFAQIAKLPWLLNQLLIGLLIFENTYLQYISFPFGVSIFAVVEKKLKGNKQ